MSLIYQINRSQRRRTLAIKITRGEVVVQAPSFMAEQDIHGFVMAKRAWIEKHQQKQQQQLASLPQRSWQAGERWRWLGEPMQLEVQQGTRKKVWRDGEKLHAVITKRSHPDKEPRQIIIDWYKQQALIWLDKFFTRWPKEHGLNPAGWKLANFTSKWGHCTRGGQLSFTWKLWVAPEWVVENVVIHELCHLREFNHSPAFWALVAKHSATYKEAELWLRQHGLTVLNRNFIDYAEAD